jgi:hypothetical protein
MIFYEVNGKKMVDIKTLMMLTNNTKSTMIRLLKRKKTPYLTYQNRNIYSLSDFLNEESGITIHDLTESFCVE